MISSIFGMAATLLTLRANRRKRSADTRKTIADTRLSGAEYQRMQAEITAAIQESMKASISLYEERIDRLIERNAAINQRVDALEQQLQKLTILTRDVINGAWQLHRQVCALDGEPAYIPPQGVPRDLL